MIKTFRTLKREDKMVVLLVIASIAFLMSTLVVLMFPTNGCG